jgi:hypothetical protein
MNSLLTSMNSSQIPISSLLNNPTPCAEMQVEMALNNLVATGALQKMN